MRILAGLLVDLIRAHVAALGLRMDDRCTKSEKAGARCPYCDPVFPRLRGGRNTAALRGGSETAQTDVEAADFGNSEGGAGVDRSGPASLFGDQHAQGGNYLRGAGEGVGADFVPPERAWHGHGRTAVCGSDRPSHFVRDQPGDLGRGAAISVGVKGGTRGKRGLCGGVGHGEGDGGAGASVRMYDDRGGGRGAGSALLLLVGSWEKEMLFGALVDAGGAGEFLC